VSIFDGVVAFDDQEVPVIIGLEESGIRMSVDGSEIGSWDNGDYTIDHDGDGSYTITAESESLVFLPTHPGLFAAGLSGGIAPIPTSSVTTEIPPSPIAAAIDGARRDTQEEPAPKATTLIVFYALASMTAALGLWALITLVLG
jgi:hypothetical protein